MARFIDVCNGDADGLCAVVQWRLHQPQSARLVTGLKHDIKLLRHVRATAGDALLVCDLPMRCNQGPLLRLLAAGVAVHYFDHHSVDVVPAHPLLQAHIEVGSHTCTSLLVDRYLKGRFRAWALVGAFGDHVDALALKLARALGLSWAQCQSLQALGESLNYNAYGDTAQDVYMAPAHLYKVLARYRHPLEFVAHEVIAQELAVLRQDDLQRGQAVPPERQNARACVYVLPDAPWSRRVSGSLNNALASAQPQRAHALLRMSAANVYVVSVRAPLAAPTGAAEFCRNFGGDGRAAVAGIDRLPASQLARFIDRFLAAPWG